MDFEKNPILERMTLGLSKDWRHLVLWAHNNGVTKGLFLLMEAARLPYFENIGVRDFVNAMTQPFTQRVLTAWAQDSELCHEINQFALKFSQTNDFPHSFGGPVRTHRMQMGGVSWIETPRILRARVSGWR